MMVSPMVKFRVFLIIAILLFSSDLFGQKLSGLVRDSSGPVKTVSVNLYEPGSKKIIGISLTNEKGLFELNVPAGEKDSLFFSHIGYKRAAITVREFQKNNNLIKLEKALVVLSEVIIKSPIMIIGDTTKFNANSFKEATDHKLKDLVEHIPGFEITTDGKLKYKSRVIEKITIEGEDLFANKSALLLNSIPIHAIEELQVLENQLENKKLKGFEAGNQVYLNLSLKKDRVKVGFGDAEIGANTKGRGLVNFTNFTLAPNFRSAFIGGFESLGQSTINLETELKDAPFKEQNVWMLSEPLIETYFRLPDVYYKFNNLVNARVKLNVPVSKKLTSETELHFLADRQWQQRIFNELLLDTSGFITQQRNSGYTRKPLQALVNEKLHWDISANKDLKITLNWIGDFLKANEQRSIERLNFKDSTVNKIQNNKNFASLNIEYLAKRSSSRADFIKLLLFTGDFDQDISGLSQNYFYSFDLPYSGYGQLRYPLNVKKKGVVLEVNRLLHTKKHAFSYGFISKYDHVITTGKLSVEQLLTNTTIDINSLNNHNTLNALTSKVFVKYPLSIFGIPINLDASGGVQYYSKQYPSNQDLFKPVYNISLSREKRMFPGMYNITVKFYSQLPALSHFDSFYKPVEFNGFRRTNLPLAVVNYQSLDVFFRIGKSPYIPFTMFGISRESAGFASKQIIKPNVQLINDTLIKKPVYSANLQFNWAITPRKTKLKIQIYYFLFFDQGRLLFNDDYAVNDNISMRWNMKLSRNWRKKFYSSLEFGGDYFIPRKNKISPVPMENLLNWNAGWKNKYQFGKNATLGLNVTYFETGANTKNSIDFTSLDFLGDYSIPKSALNLSFVVQNLLNQKQLTFGDQSPTYQSIYQIPLLGINFLVKLRYAL